MGRAAAAAAGALAGCLAASAAWLPSLALFALAVGGVEAFAGARLGSANGVVLILAMPALGLAQGAVTGAMRGRADGATLAEAALSPFAWLTTAGEGVTGGAVMLASLLPGACVGALAGLWAAAAPAETTRWPAEAGVGAVVGVVASLLGLNVFVQRRPPPEPEAEATETTPEVSSPGGDRGDGRP